MKHLIVCAILMATASPLAAQASVVMPERLSPEQVSVRNAYLVLRDSLHAVEAGGARLVRDKRGSSDASLSSRARVISRGCTAALGLVDSTRVRMMTIESAQPRVMERRSSLSSSFTELAAGLGKCQAEFTRLAEPANVEELRGYGFGRAEAIREIIQHFNKMSWEYLRILGIEVRPIGAGANPLAG
ncbi:MAG: hypothetical protein ACREL6_07020 [Gemmatimonadales bacterium]